MTCRCFQRIQRFLRAAWRALWLAAEIVRGAATYRAGDSLMQQACWLHRVCRRSIRIFSVKVNSSAKMPLSGLLVANHLSYLDILLLGSLAPCVFVAKAEVGGWPIFGWFARMSGTIFVNRKSRRDTVHANSAIRCALRQGALVVLFPEGTSSDGAQVLPFKTSLLQGATEGIPISAAAMRYRLSEGNAAEEVCYWGGHTLVPHLLNLMTKESVEASITLCEVPNKWYDRKQLAAHLHAEVARLHAAPPLFAETSLFEPVIERKVSHPPATVSAC